MKILVVDDEKLLVKGIRFNLEHEGYEVDECYDGAAAVAKAAETQYDLILLDLMMPEMDGLEATRTIRALQLEDAKTIPIIAMTANAFEEDKKKVLVAGMNAHLAKPIEMELVLRTISTYVHRSKGEKS